MTAAQVAEAVGGILAADGSLVISSVSQDTRELEPGALYVAIRGPRFDGHRFVTAALEKGAVLLLVNRDAELPGDVPCIRVEDTVKALGALAAWHRSRFDIPVIAVTGSVGKTSTREMIAAALSARYHVLRNRENFNNEIGVPLSVLQLDDSHTAAVFELGMRALGEIGWLARIARPDISVITNIGLSHIEKLGSRQNILRAKLEIIEGMPADGVVILNGEDELLKGLRGLLRYKTLYYGMDEATDIQGYEAASLAKTAWRSKPASRGRTVRSPSARRASTACPTRLRPWRSAMCWGCASPRRRRA
jgi:UDP-N-acetylmuramoyl-tripeptide--D-alanyl-D-alanine ligase